MACSCRSDSCTRARRRRMGLSGTTRASGIGWRGSEDAPAWSRRPSAWWTSASPCSPASLETTGSPASYLCSPKTLIGEDSTPALVASDRLRAPNLDLSHWWRDRKWRRKMMLPQEVDQYSGELQPRAQKQTVKIG